MLDVQLVVMVTNPDIFVVFSFWRAVSVEIYTDVARNLEQGGQIITVTQACWQRGAMCLVRFDLWSSFEARDVIDHQATHYFEEKAQHL